MKKLFGIFLILSVLMIMIFPCFAANKIASMTAENGVITVYFTEEINNGYVELSVTNNGEILYSTTKSFSGSGVSIGLPARGYTYDNYNITVKCYENGTEIGTKTITVAFGNVSGGDVDNNSLHASRAVMQPYADIYADAGMGNKIATLKKYDYVQIISMVNSTTAKVKFRIQSGNGTTEAIDNIHAEYYSDDDIESFGFMSMAAFTAPSLSMSDEDRQRDAVELAYSRLGMRGVYNQGKRLRDCYVDCSALASYCWYQVGVDFTDGGSTTVKGIATWALGHHAVLWQVGVSQDQTGLMLAPEDGGDSFTNDEGTFSGSDLISYSRTFDPNYFKQMQPGDLICYTYGQTFTAEDGTQFASRIANTYDHVAIFVGCNVSDSGNVLSVTLIESSNAHVNTKISSPSPSSIVNNISMVVRPTGCDEIEGGIEHNPAGSLTEISLPIDQYTIGSEYGQITNEETGETSFHNGIDFMAPAGTAVRAIGSGIVTSAGTSAAYGKYVIIKHNDTYSSLYGFLSNTTVASGDTVTKGQMIGHIGNSENGTYQLHLIIYKDGIPVDPRTILS